jgi:hypothetical protein
MGDVPENVVIEIMKKKGFVFLFKGRAGIIFVSNPNGSRSICIPIPTPRNVLDDILDREGLA